MIEKRPDKGIWANLYQLPLIESEDGLLQKLKPIYETQHLLSHQKLYCSFYKSSMNEEANRIRVDINEMQHYAVPAVIDKFLKQYFN